MEAQQDSTQRVQIMEEGGGGAGWGAIKYYRQEAPPRFIQLVLKHSGGIVKSEEQASKVLIVIVCISFLLSAIIVAYTFLGIGKKSEPVPTVYLEDLSPELMRTLPIDAIRKLPSRPTN